MEIIRIENGFFDKFKVALSQDEAQHRQNIRSQCLGHAISIAPNAMTAAQLKQAEQFYQWVLQENKE
jgi:hypothetical protein